MAESAQVRGKLIQIGLYSAAILTLVALVAGLTSLLFPEPRRAPMPTPVAAPPPPLAVAPSPAPALRMGQLERIRAALQDEITAGSITVEPFGSWVAVRVENLITFASGQATALPGFVPVARKVAGVVEAEQGPVRIVGHTDDQALAPGGAFRDNQALSVARAEAVAALIRPALSDPGRVTVEGRGASEPVADNAGQEGRARNRRVEVLITRTDRPDR